MFGQACPGHLPRVHDFRHAFAVAAPAPLVTSDADWEAQSELPQLSMYMGHVSIASTTLLSSVHTGCGYARERALRQRVRSFG